MGLRQSIRKFWRILYLHDGGCHQLKFLKLLHLTTLVQIAYEISANGSVALEITDDFFIFKIWAAAILLRDLAAFDFSIAWSSCQASANKTS